MKIASHSNTGVDKTTEDTGANQTPTTYSDKILRATEIEFWNKRYATQEFIWTVNANSYLVAEAANLYPGVALDLAGGEGRNAIWLAEQGWNVHSVDFCDVALEKGKQLAAVRKVADRINFREADLRAFDPGMHLYDLVTLIYLQIPLPDLIPIIKRSAQAVATGGTFLLVAHDSTNLDHGFGGPRHPTLLYTAEQVVAALDGELTIEKATCVERAVETANGTQIALDCIVRGKRP